MYKNYVIFDRWFVVLLVLAGITIGTLLWAAISDPSVSTELEESPAATTTQSAPEVLPTPTPMPTVLPTPVAEYMAVSIEDLIANPKQYDGMAVEVAGTFRDTHTLVITTCYDTGGDNPVLTEGYLKVPSPWGLSQGTNILAVLVRYDEPVGSPMPLYEEGQALTLRGIARYAEVPERCNSNNLHPSVYIEVPAEDIDLPPPGKKITP